MLQGPVPQAQGSNQNLSAGATLRSSRQHGTPYPTLALRNNACNLPVNQALRQPATPNLPPSYPILAPRNDACNLPVDLRQPATPNISTSDPTLAPRNGDWNLPVDQGTPLPTLAPRNDAWNLPVDPGLRQHATTNFSSSTNGVQHYPSDFSVQGSHNANTS